jgi:hypothetical protein
MKSTYININDTSNFTEFGTQEIQNVAPVLSSPSPSNSATGISLNPTLTITVNDTNAEAMNVTFYTNVTGSWGLIGYNDSVYNGTYTQTNDSMNSYDTTYWWSVNVTDYTTWTNATYSFTTKNAPLTLTIRPILGGQSTQLIGGPPAGPPLQNWERVDEINQNADVDFVYSELAQIQMK